MKNILVTGSRGQLGLEIQAQSSANPNFNLFLTDIGDLDICDKDAIVSFIDRFKIDYIINCAAYTAVDKAEDETEACYRINRDAVGYLADAASGKAKIIHISTDYVFDGNGNLPYKETDPTNPQTVYGKSKCEGEDLLLEKCPESIIIRTAWLYSVNGNNFVNTMIRLGKEREIIQVVSDQKGAPTFVGDLSAVIFHIISWCEKQQEFPAGIYHYSNEGICSWYEFAQKIHQYAGVKNCKINPVTTEEYPVKAPRPRYSVLDKSKIKNAFNLTIPQWEDSLKKCMDQLGNY